MTLYLSIKPVYYQQILHGYKTNEYRDMTDYYTTRLVQEESIDEPSDPEGFVRCTDGKWRKFHRYDRVHFICKGVGESDYAVKSIDVGSGKYIIRLGKKL